MRTNSYISAAALAAALLAFPHAATAQDDGLNLDLGGIGVDADVDLGGDTLLDVDAGVSLGDDTGVDASVEVGRSDADDSLVDVDLDATSGSTSEETGPNGGQLIDLDDAALDADIDVLSGGGDSNLLDGTIRIGALDNDLRAQALLDLIETPNLADVDLDAAIDDTRVSILAAADLLSDDDLAKVEAAITAGGNGRSELLAALDASVELGSILDNEGIDAQDVLAVQIADNGAAEIIVLGDGARLALLGDDGDAADLAVGTLATADVDLLSGEELAEADVNLFPQETPTSARLRLFGNDDAGDGQLDLADLSIAELSELDVDLLLAEDSTDSGSDGSGTDDGTGDGDGDGSAGNGDDGTGGNTGADGGTGSDTGDTGGDDGDATAETDGVVTGALPATAGFAIAALDCDIGVLALANGADATPQAIANADSLELVRIDGCERSLVDAEIGTIRSAIAVNPALSGVLDDASISLDQVIGATIQGGTLTLFIEPAVVS